MAQYKHDRFFKFYIQSLYKTKGDTLQNIQVRNDEDLEIDLMFTGVRENAGWQQENLGLFDILMQEHPTIIIEHYSSYLEDTDILKSITRKNLYWERKQKELVENAKSELELTSSQRLSKEAKKQIENQNPFTWILTVNCSEKLLALCGAQPATELGTGVYRLSQIFRMGIVIIEQLVDSPETMWLKMLGGKHSAQTAFESIKQLSPERREKNDIISACIKYCVYLRNIPTYSLTPEEEDFMKTMAQIDAWYEAEINKAKLEGKIEGKIEGKLEGKIESASTIIRAKFGAQVLTPQIASQLEELNEQQLDDFIVGMFNWQQKEMESWLQGVEKV
ncbi:MAG: hypothetical protein KME64_21760 [Scytonematopsis contorta HA4267-MV1]|jgi:hypothetical protein|nr:hypothetical protein [Scytonematopsis contorta HA4267-MV1]